MRLPWRRKRKVEYRPGIMGPYASMVAQIPQDGVITLPGPWERDLAKAATWLTDLKGMVLTVPPTDCPVIIEYTAWQDTELVNEDGKIIYITQAEPKGTIQQKGSLTIPPSDVSRTFRLLPLGTTGRWR